MYAKIEEQLAAMSERMEAAKKEAAEQKLLADAIQRAHKEREDCDKEKSQKPPPSNREKRRAAQRANSPGGPGGSDSSSSSGEFGAEEDGPRASRARNAASPIDPEKDL